MCLFLMSIPHCFNYYNFVIQSEIRNPIWYPLELSIYNISSANIHNSSFLIWMLYIYLISCPIFPARMPSIMLNESVESGHPSIIPDLREEGFRFSLLRMMLAVGLTCMSSIMLRYIPSKPTLLRGFFFNHK